MSVSVGVYVSVCLCVSVSVCLSLSISLSLSFSCSLALSLFFLSKRACPVSYRKIVNVDCLLMIKMGTRKATLIPHIGNQPTETKLAL